MSKLSFQVNQAESEGCRLFNGKCFFLEERLKLTKPFQAENPHLRIFTLYLLRDPRASLADIKVFYAKKSLANTKVFMSQKVLLISMFFMPKSLAVINVFMPKSLADINVFANIVNNINNVNNDNCINNFNTVNCVKISTMSTVPMI